MACCRAALHDWVRRLAADSNSAALFSKFGLFWMTALPTMRLVVLDLALGPTGDGASSLVSINSTVIPLRWESLLPMILLAAVRRCGD